MSEDLGEGPEMASDLEREEEPEEGEGEDDSHEVRLGRMEATVKEKKGFSS